MPRRGWAAWGIPVAWLLPETNAIDLAAADSRGAPEAIS
jgi:hypothetical protein